jgi:hypothetical protein
MLARQVWQSILDNVARSMVRHHMLLDTILFEADGLLGQLDGTAVERFHQGCIQILTPHVVLVRPVRWWIDDIYDLRRCGWDGALSVNQKVVQDATGRPLLAVSPTPECRKILHRRRKCGHFEQSSIFSARLGAYRHCPRCRDHMLKPAS